MVGCTNLSVIVFYLMLSRSYRALLVLLTTLLLALPLRSEPQPQVRQNDTYPWRVEATTNLNIRALPGADSQKLGMFTRGTQFDALYQTTSYWIEIRYQGRKAYVSSRYVRFLYQISVNEAYGIADTPDEGGGKGNSFWHGAWTFLGKLLRILVGIGLLILIAAFWEQLLQIGIFFGFCYAIGGAITYFIFGNWDLGGWIGLGLAALLTLRLLMEFLNVEISGNLLRWVLGAIYYTVSLVPYFLNRLQHVIASPWRYVIRRNTMTESTKAFLRTFFGILTIPLYIVLTPLRLVNAVYFNILVHGLAGLYDLMLEVLWPCCEDEGAGNFWKWLLFLPWRFVKYFLGHGLFLLLESVVWTVIDVFVPAVTLYHGTDLTAGQCIVGCQRRNSYLRRVLGSGTGTFRASSDSWAGIGVYFASRRKVAGDYAQYRKLSDNNPVTIVCRVSMGKTINMALAPWSVYSAIGRNGNPATLNRYADSHHYVTGEWWNQSYWEYCLFDWQHLYNERWRIRPIYLFNHRTNFIQHIKGGMAHWSINI